MAKILFVSSNKLTNGVWSFREAFDLKILETSKIALFEMFGSVWSGRKKLKKKKTKSNRKTLKVMFWNFEKKAEA